MGVLTKQSKIIYGAAVGTLAVSGLYLYKVGGVGAFALTKKDDGKGDTGYCSASKAGTKYDGAKAVLKDKGDQKYYYASRVAQLAEPIKNDPKGPREVIKSDGKIYQSDGTIYKTEPVLDPGALLFKGDKGYLKSDGKILGKVDSKMTNLMSTQDSVYTMDGKTIDGLYRTDGKLSGGVAGTSATTVCTSSNALLDSVKESEMTLVLMLDPIKVGSKGTPTPPSKL